MKPAVFIALLAGLFLIACNTDRQPEDTIKSRIDSVAKAYLADPKTASLVIGIYREGSTTPEIFSYGILDKANRKKPDSTTIYKLGSVGKTFTATTLAWYAVNKPQSLQLNDTINKFFPAGQNLPFWTSGSNTGDTTKITLLNLAMHYSSLPDTQPNHVRPPMYTIEKLMEFLGSDRADWRMRPLTIQPGTKWIYSNTAFGLLGVVMERISGLAYQDLLDTVFCNELNMPDTRIQLNNEQLSRLAPGHHNGDSVNSPLTSPAFYGAGGNYSCMNDMVKYLAWNMGLTNAGINNLLDTLHTARDTARHSTSWQGLAWQINPLRPKSPQKYIAKDGATTGYSAFICFVPETKTGVVVLANNFDKGSQFDNIGPEVLRILNPVR